MRSDLASSWPDSKRLTLGRIMTVIAGLAIAFAFLPWLFSAPFAVTVLGILVLEAMRLPLVTSGRGVRRWLPWILWSVTLAACPFAIGVVGVLYQNHGAPTHDGWATRVVSGLGFAQVGVSVIASVAVVVLTRGWYRALAWAAVMAIGAATLVAYFCASMTTTLYYL